jgi:hypothetical protein
VRGIWRFRQFLARLREAHLLAAAKRAVGRFPTVHARRPHGLPGELVVSLTSYPARFSTLALTLRSLLDQQVGPDRLVLWLGHEHLAAVPDDVRALEMHGLEIRGCIDIRSYTKLVPALAEWPDAFIITADDDLYYPPHWLGALVDAYDPADPAIICWRAHLARVDTTGRLEPYRSWPMHTAHREDHGARRLLFPTGCGGVFYPPYSLSPQVSDQSLFERLCPQADDVWFFWMAERQGTRHQRVAAPFELVPWEGSQEVGLFAQNVLENGNDLQIQAVEGELGSIWAGSIPAASV